MLALRWVDVPRLVIGGWLGQSIFGPRATRGRDGNVVVRNGGHGPTSDAMLTPEANKKPHSFSC